MNAITEIPSPEPLTRACPHCEDGTKWKSRYGGNDPDVWPVRCDECDGTGDEDIICEGWKCRAPATEWFQGLAWCPACAAEQKRDAFSADEDDPDDARDAMIERERG